MKKILLIFTMLIGSFSFGQAITQSFTSSGSYTIPSGVTSITVEAWGGGGKGGARATSTGACGGGGGGAYARNTFTVVPGNSYSFVVGAGATTSSPGGDTYFVNTTTLLAKGGSSVADNTTTGATGGLASGSIGLVTFNGGNGATGSGTIGGGGGSSAGNALSGVNATNATGATAPTGGGSGGAGRSGSTGVGTTGSNPGGGGSGAYRSTSGSSAGGAGGSGQITITCQMPYMNVKGNNNIIVDDDTSPITTDWTDFISTNVNSPIARTFTIENIGNTSLSLSGSPIVSISGTDFTITTQPNATIAAGSSSTFVVTFNPSSIGVKTADISITNNDPSANKNPYTFRVTGVGVQAFPDTDGDGIYNNLDSDDDNDGIPDTVEQNFASGSATGTSLNVVLLNETFGVGTTRARINVNVPTASTTYCYEDGTTAQAADECDTAIDVNDGQYTVNYESGSLAVASWAPQYWYQGTDHTTDTNGRMAIFNATSNITDEFYRTVFQGVIPNAPLTYSFWILNLDRADAPGIATRYRPNITVEFRDLSNNLISTITTGDIAPSAATPTASDWKQYSATFTPSTTGFSIIFKNNQVGGIGNDLALDDILITQKLTDTDQDGVADVLDLDSDNDGIGGIIEDGWAALSNGKDKMDMTAGVWIDNNYNGWHDTVEAYYASHTTKDFDGDAVPNYLDLDSDNDAVFDVDEAGLTNGDGDINCDGQGEGTDADSDGILAPFDNYVGFGNSSKTTPTNTLGSGNPDYLKVSSKTAGVYDISTTLYAALDTDNNGTIEGSTDIDKDGILDVMDTNTSLYGSPRDFNRKLFLDFDGRNDYGQENVQILDGLSNATLMAWIDLNSTFSSTGVIVGQNNLQLRINSSKNIEANINSTTLSFSTKTLNTNQWYHVGVVYGGGSLKLYLNGLMVASTSASGTVTSDGSKLTIGKDPSTSTKYFKGKIDELRIFNVALTDAQLQKMVYQEIQNTSSQVRGAIIPMDIGSLPFSNLLRYFKMDVYKNDIIDDLTTSTIDVGTGMKIYNNKNINYQQAPLPFVTKQTGNFATAVNDTSNDVRGMDIMDQDWSIVQVKHDITETSNNIDLGMIVDAGKTVTMNNDTKIQNDWYLQLNGKIDLQGASQLVQTINSVVDATSAGSIERDQQGQNNIYNYNYWSSPVGPINNTTNNNAYTVAGVMKDGTTSTPQNITWTSGLNGSPTSPITLSSYWIYKFQNVSNSYANWQSVGSSGSLNPAQGYTMKGSGTANTTQNYTFVGKPYNGPITSSISAANLNLCGNPYASAIDANAFINANLTSTTGTLYFWQHYSTNTSHNLIAYQGGYATRTLVGGTPPVSPAGISGLGSSSRTAGRYIPVGQGFFVSGSAVGGTITFNNDQRIFVKESDANSNYMFKNSNSVVVDPSQEAYPLSNNAEDPHEAAITSYRKLRLGFTDNANYHRQTLLGFMENNATSGIDVGYDGEHIDNQPNDMYFINNGVHLNISGEGFYNENNVYPLGVVTNVAGTVQFMVDDKENFQNGDRMYIYDNVTNVYNEITNNAITLDLPLGTIENRFFLTFKENALSAPSFDLNSNIQIAFSSSNSMLTIKNSAEETNITSVDLINILGQVVSTWKVDQSDDQSYLQFPVKQLSEGTYIARINTTAGSLSKKLIIK